MVKETADDEISSELDIYLLEKSVPREDNGLGLNYDVLSWWKRNSSKYPILSEFARDVLAIQVSSVASESAFTLVCSQQWIRITFLIQNLLPWCKCLRN
ncbi:unnamed protein product [Brassica oleracea]|uniref:(rape) hypothetical protein n=1 Tax=Brassica napus TaxID=3708 RepID=A0A816M0R3_BRANA|nr:unnamed protein product [Brassica napus]